MVVGWLVGWLSMTQSSAVEIGGRPLHACLSLSTTIIKLLVHSLANCGNMSVARMRVGVHVCVCALILVGLPHLPCTIESA
jgi:hypothetical protein